MIYFNKKTGRIARSRLSGDYYPENATMESFSENGIYSYEYGVFRQIGASPLSEEELEEMTLYQQEQARKAQVMKAEAEKKEAEMHHAIESRKLAKEAYQGGFSDQCHQRLFEIARLAHTEMDLTGLQGIDTGRVVEALIRAGAELPLLGSNAGEAVRAVKRGFGLKFNQECFAHINLRTAMSKYGTNDGLLAHYRHPDEDPTEVSDTGLFLYQTDNPTLLRVVRRNKTADSGQEVMGVSQAQGVISLRSNNGWFSNFVNPVFKETTVPRLEFNLKNASVHSAYKRRIMDRDTSRDYEYHEYDHVDDEQAQEAHDTLVRHYMRTGDDYYISMVP